MQKVLLMGHLGGDCVVREVGDKVAINFSVAHSEKFKDKDGITHEKTQWWDCTVWRQQSQSREIAKWLTKGTRVFVEGNPTFDIYRDKVDKPQIACRLSVTNLELISSTKEKQEGDNTQNPPKAEAPSQGSITDDLPF